MKSMVCKIKQDPKYYLRLAAMLLTVALVVGQFGLFRSVSLDVSAAETHVRQWMNVTVSASVLNVRTSPQVANNIFDTLNNGHRVYVWTSQTTNGYTWYLVTYISNNVPRTGYVVSDYIKPMTTTTDDDFEDELEDEGFPESYKPSLRKLHELHPDWIFKAQQTGVSWSTALDNELAAFRSVIPMSNNKSYRSTDSVTYQASSNTWIGSDNQPIPSGGWVMANRSTLSFYMDPRNMIDSYRVFMFESLSYDDEIHNAEGVNKILSNTFMGNNAQFDYNGGKISYAQAFMDAAGQSDVSPYHLAARSRQEVGNYSGSVTGTYSASYPYVYNYYNIGANDTNDPVINGLQWALLGPDRKSEYTSTDAAYLIPWQDTRDGSGNVTNFLGRYRSIVGGAKFIGNSYINVGQDTLYLQKFDVIDDAKYGRYWHQYMTFIGAPYSESVNLANTYRAMGITDSRFVFTIPVYQDMPQEPVPLPVGNGNVNNYLEGLSVKDVAVSPAFNRSKTSGYTVSLPYTVTKLDLTTDFNADTESDLAKVTITGPSDLQLGNNQYILTVQASYGNDPRTYSLTVVREASPDKIPPVITLGAFDATTPTNQDITVNASTNEGTLNATSYVFSANGSFTFTATDNVGNVSNQTVTISNIDKEAPAAPTATASLSSPTSGDITVTPIYSDDTVVKQFKIGIAAVWQDYTAPVVVSINDTIFFKGQDKAGNWSTDGSIVIGNIDKTAPTMPTIVASSTELTNEDVTVTPTFSDDSLVRHYKVGITGTWTDYSIPVVLSNNETVYFKGQDSAGNWSEIGSIKITNIDKTAPETPTAEASQPAPITGNVTVTPKFSDDSEVQEYKIGQNGTWTKYLIPVELIQNETVYFRSQDAAGNMSAEGSIIISSIIREIPETPTAVASPTSETEGPVTVTLSSGLTAAKKQYKLGSESTSWLDYTVPIVLDDNNTIYFKCQNTQGIWSEIGSIVINNINKPVPATPTAEASPTVDTEGPVTVTLSFNLTNSKKQYKLGSESTIWVEYKDPIELKTNNTVYFKEQDANGNWSAVGTLVVNNIKDLTPPVITIGSYNDTKPTNLDITVTASSNEGTLNATSVVFNANGSFTFIATDAAGHKTSKTISIDNIDKIAPDAPTVSASSTEATNGTVTVTAIYSKDSASQHYRIGTTGDWVEYKEPVNISANGTVYFKGQDEAGNWSTEGSLNVNNIDKTAPTAPTAIGAPSTATNGTVTVTPSYSADSAVRQYRIGNQGAWTAYTGPIVITSNETIYFKGQDAAGNWSTEGNLVISNIDKTGPDVPTAVASPESATTGSVTVTLSFSADSAVKQYKIGDSSSWNDYTSALVIKDNDTVYFKAQDAAGNWSHVGSLEISNIEKTSPTTTETTTPTTTTSTTSDDSGGGGGGGGGGGSDEPATDVQSSTYRISGNTISGINPVGGSNTVSALSSKLSVPTGSTILVLKPSGGTASSNDRIGTGYKIQIMSGGSVLSSYTAIVYGDTTGDGAINIMDVATLFKYVRNKQSLGTAYQMAGDTDHNAKVNIMDVATAFKHVRSKLTIVQ